MRLAIKSTLLLIVVGVLAACGATQRERTIKATLITVNAARDGFIAWNLAHQNAIVDQAVSKEDAIAKISAYRAAREPVIEGFVKIYQLISKAVVLSKDPKLLTDILSTAKLLEADLKRLKAGSP